jgi:hypothetical protein
MWHRFTEQARRVVFCAQSEAERFGDTAVRPEHLLLGLIAEPDTLASRVIIDSGTSLVRLRAEVEKLMESGTTSPSSDMTLTETSRRVVQLAYDESHSLGGNSIGTEHLLLGLLREGENLAAKVLAKMGFEIEQVYNLVVDLRAARREALPDPKPTRYSSKLVSSPDFRNRQRAALRSRLVFVNGDSEVSNNLGDLLRALALVPLDWAQAIGFTGKEGPTIDEVVETAFAVGGAIIFALGRRPGPQEGEETHGTFEERLFAAGVALGAEPQKAILVTPGDTKLGYGLDPYLVRLDNSSRARLKLIAALRDADCLLDTSGHWLNVGDFDY